MGGDLVDASSLCWTYAQTGYCPRGAACRWTHDQLPRNKTDTICRAWLLWGNCPRADQCTWHHPPVCIRSTAPWWASDPSTVPEDFWCQPTLGSSETHSASGAQAGRELLSMIGAGDDHEIGQETCRPLQTWCAQETSEDHRDYADPSVMCAMTSPMHMNSVLEDMSELPGPWDQFEVNETVFNVKSSFKEDLSQYTTELHISKIPTGIKQEAERIASEIENEHKESGRLDDDGYAIDADGSVDEEMKFAAVTRQVIQLQ